MESLEEQWKHLRLSTEEESNIVVDEEAVLEELRKGENSLIGKVHTEHSISKEVLRTTTEKAWRPNKPFSVKEIQVNNYIFSFDNHNDLDRVLS